MRAFLGLPLPDALAGPLSDLAQEVPVGRPVAHENLHLTLAFLGEQPEARLATLATEISTADLPGASLAPGGLELMGGERVLAVVMTGPEALHARLMRKVREAGIELERRRFRPHVTLARLPRRLSREEEERLAGFLSRGAPPLPTAPAEELALYRSQLGPEGARYDILAAWPLGPAPQPEDTGP